MSRHRTPLALATAALVLGLALAGCGQDSDQVSAQGQERGPNDTIPLPCSIVDAPRPSMPADAPTSTTLPIEVETVTQEQERAAIEILRSDPRIAEAIGGGRLAWVTPWYIVDDVERGALLFYEFDRPVSLPSELGVPVGAGGGDTGGPPPYDRSGLPVLERVEDTAEFEQALSARFAVDLVDGRLHHIVAGSENVFC